LTAIIDTLMRSPHAALFLRFIRIFEICVYDVERLKFRIELI
jgi:hypothetical protein